MRRLSSLIVVFVYSLCVRCFCSDSAKWEWSSGGVVWGDQLFWQTDNRCSLEQLRNKWKVTTDAVSWVHISDWQQTNAISPPPFSSSIRKHTKDFESFVNTGLIDIRHLCVDSDQSLRIIVCPCPSSSFKHKQPQSAADEWLLLHKHIKMEEENHRHAVHWSIEIELLERPSSRRRKSEPFFSVLGVNCRTQSNTIKCIDPN